MFHTGLVTGEEPTLSVDALRDAITSVQKQNLDPEASVIRSNLPLARLKLRKAELLLTVCSYLGARQRTH